VARQCHISFAVTPWKYSKNPRGLREVVKSRVSPLPPPAPFNYGAASWWISEHCATIPARHLRATAPGPMPIDRTSAERICNLIQEASASCHDSLRVLKEHETLGAIQVYGRLVGRFLGHSYTNLLAPIWAAYPDMEPQEMKQPFVPPEATLTPESRAAIEAFLSTATAAMRETAGILAMQQPPAILPYGGFEEVESTVSEVGDFLAKPRFRDEEPGDIEQE